MKTFYDLLDTKRTIRYCCEISALFETVPPKVRLEINGEVVHDGHLRENKIFKGDLDPETHIKLRITLQDKQYNKDSVSAVKLRSFVVDDFELKDQITHRSVYEHDSSDEHNTVTDHIGWNGSWQFDAGMPFYHFKHKVMNRGWLISPRSNRKPIS